MSAKMVRLYQVGKSYASGRYALKDINFDLEAGEFAFVTGVSGAGKSTLLKLLFAMERATAGSLYVNNRDLGELSPKEVPKFRQNIGFVFQDFKLLPELTVFENIRLPLDIKRLSEREVEHRVMGVLSLVGLADRAEDFPTVLSGGEQQRVAIARSIIGKPALLLADEPTGNLDSRTAHEIMQLFLEIRDMGTTVLIATHDETLLQSFPNRTIELEKGQLILDQGGRIKSWPPAEV